MKKYVVKYEENGSVFGEYASRKEAFDMIMWYIRCYNELLDSVDDYICPFDFLIEEEETSVADFISDFESAKRYLKLEGSNEKNIEALIALDQLFTIAEAWNKADGFVPDFNNYAQQKWVPTFEYNDDDTGLIFWASTFYSSSAPYDVGFRLCFKTSERAEQFGKQFIGLYNKAFLSNK